MKKIYGYERFCLHQVGLFYTTDHPPAPYILLKGTPIETLAGY